jgi:Zn-dependent protease
MLVHFLPHLPSLMVKCTLVLLCMAGHELGHVLAAGFFRVPVKKMGFNRLGIYIRRSRTVGWPEVSICLAGAGMNLMLALVFWNTSTWFALCNLTFGWVNLLPLPRSDGSHALEAFRAMTGQPNA